MARVTFWFNDSENYVNVEAEEFHEDGDFLKAYSSHHELIAMFDMKIIKGAYLTEQKK
jgi:hypothetical protein